MAIIPGAPDYLRFSDRRYRDEQRPPHPLYRSAIAASIFAGSLYGAHRVGLASFGGKRGYDYLVSGIRHLEEYTPINLFRTFQLGSFFSQFTSQAAETRFFSPEKFINDRVLRSYTTALLGGDAAASHRLMLEGATFRGGKLYWGAGEEIALKYASVVVNPLITETRVPMARWSAAYARSLGVDDFARLWQGRKFERYFGTEGVQLIGGASRFQSISRQASAWGTELVGRFNRLLLDPAELPIASQAFGAFRGALAKATGGKITMPFGLGVRPSGGLSMLGRLGLKWGGVATLGWLAYKEVDRLTRNASIFDNTLFSEGLTVAAGTLWARANVSASKAADKLGLHAYREKQEEIAPGSTEFSRLIGFPIAGAFVGGTVSYGRRVYETVRRQLAGVPLEAAAAEAAKATSEFGSGWFGKMGQALKGRGGIFSQLTPTKLGAFLGLGVGVALVAPFLPGALVPSQKPEELEAIYSGEQEVPVRKGRYWPLGRSRFEGEQIQYYAPHWLPRTKWRAHEKSLWGEETDTLSEFEKFYKKEFTYYLEEKNPYGFAAPISSLPLEDVPLIGPLLANTVGRLIKPPRLLRTDEWREEGPGGEITYAPEGLRYGERFAPELGELPRGAPESPYGLKQAFREQYYRFSEMMGLPGFISTAIKEKLTGTQDHFSDIQELESFRRAHGVERQYWEEELGDPIGITEGFRRLYPHRIHSVPLYNPLPSGAPSWLPGAGERSPNFQEGMLFAKVPLGETRLPGRGFAARYPELEGVSPEDYPDLYKYMVLADVAPYSDKFDEVSARIRRERKGEGWSEYSEGLYQKAQKQMAARKIRKEFFDYQYLEPYGKPGAGTTVESQVLSALNEAQAAGVPRDTTIRKLFGGYWEWLAHSMETSLEQITPVAPINKFVHVRDAVEDYKRTQLYSDDYAFWQTPIESFIKPFAYTSAAAFGYEGIPSAVKQRRDIESYFDVLKYIKYHRLAIQAQEAGDSQAVTEYSGRRSETLFGLNPYTKHIGNIYRALPRGDRDYFANFVAARTPEERAQIIKMVPENQKALYTAQWQMRYMDNVRQGVRQGQIAGELADEAMRQVDEIDQMRSNQGLPKDKELFGEYLQTRLSGESYPDWYKRTRLLARALSGKHIPGPDFVAFNPATDIDDYKLRLAQAEGIDSHDFGIWDDQVRSAEYKPYITPEVVNDLARGSAYTEDEIKARLDSVFGNKRMVHSQSVTQQYSPFGKNTVTINVEHDRRRELRRRLKETLNG